MAHKSIPLTNIQRDFIEFLIDEKFYNDRSVREGLEAVLAAGCYFDSKFSYSSFDILYIVKSDRGLFNWFANRFKDDYKQYKIDEAMRDRLLKRRREKRRRRRR